MELILERYGSTPYGTFGCLTVPGSHLKFYTVECPWRGNRRSVSCVPHGEYQLVWQRTTTAVPEEFAKHTWYLDGETVAPLSDGVRQRSNCAIHIGNSQKDVSGCIAVGMNLAALSDRTWGVGNSRAALLALRQLIGEHGNVLQIEPALCG